MFTAERWASAFIRCSGEYAEDGLAALQVILPCITRIPGYLSGTSAARHVDQICGIALKRVGISNPGIEYACRMLVLLVKKGYFAYSGALVEAIERILDQKKGRVAVILESASVVDAEFQETLQRKLRERLARTQEIRDVVLKTRIVPELLGGYRLRIGSEIVDASVRFLLQKMAAQLQGIS
jgi:F-type H+-transporting ATPase subunit delta